MMVSRRGLFKGLLGLLTLPFLPSKLGEPMGSNIFAVHEHRVPNSIYFGDKVLHERNIYTIDRMNLHRSIL